MMWSFHLYRISRHEAITYMIKCLEALLYNLDQNPKLPNCYIRYCRSRYFQDTLFSLNYIMIFFFFTGGGGDFN